MKESIFRIFFYLNIHTCSLFKGKPMFDYMDEFKTRYRSKSGQSMYVPVSVPIIANPPQRNQTSRGLVRLDNWRSVQMCYSRIPYTDTWLKASFLSKIETFLEIIL